MSLIRTGGYRSPPPPVTLSDSSFINQFQKLEPPPTSVGQALPNVLTRLELGVTEAHLLLGLVDLLQKTLVSQGRPWGHTCRLALPPAGERSSGRPGTGSPRPRGHCCSGCWPRRGHLPPPTVSPSCRWRKGQIERSVDKIATLLQPIKDTHKIDNSLLCNSGLFLFTSCPT